MANNKERTDSRADKEVDTPVKVCRTCGLQKFSTEFWRDKYQKDGRKQDCIECSKAHWRKRITREQRDRYIERQTRYEALHIRDYLLRQARRRAKDLGIECTIRARDIPDPPEVCPILGVKLVKNQGSWSNDSYSLDRVDSSKGYIPGNVRVISWRANNLKSNMTVEEVERLLRYMKGEL